MPSARDESRGPQANKDAPSSTNELGSVADSVQSLRNLAGNLSLPAINETEKKLKQVIEQLASMQETLSKLNEARSRAQASVEETKKKSPPKSASPNVIPLRVPARPDDRSRAPDQSSEPSIASPEPRVETDSPQIESLQSASVEPIAEKVPPSTTEIAEWQLEEDGTAKEARQQASPKREPVEDAVPNQPVSSRQSLRNVAENPSFPAINETEKKLKEAIEQLASMQGNLSKLNEVRSRAQVSVEETETKKKSPAKSESPNVIPLRVPARPDDRSRAPDQSSEPSIASPEPRVETDSLQIESLQSASVEPIAEKVPPSTAKIAEWPLEEDETAKEARQQARAQREPDDDVAYNQPVSGDLRSGPAAQTARPEQDRSAVITPEIVSPNEPVVQERILPSRRAAAVDDQIRALVKQYGEVDIYAHREDGKQNLLKTAVAGLILIAALAISYLLLA